MDRDRICKQLIEFQKVTFDNSYCGLTKLQEQGEEMINTFLARSNWLPSEGRKAFTDWLKAYRKARCEFKRSVDENFEKIMEFFGCDCDKDALQREARPEDAFQEDAFQEDGK
jgi:hypothetical protein